jgi:hypothetical protein
MILRDAIKYLELNKTDFITDLNEFAELQRNFESDIVPDDFTERYEGFCDKLLNLWTESKGGYDTVLNSGIDIPTKNALIRKYCRITFVSEKAKKNEGKTFFKSELLIKKKDKLEKDNQTIELITFLGANDIDITQFLDMEIDVVYKVISIIAEKKKEDEKKRKKKRG